MTLYEEPLTPAGSAKPAQGETGRMFQMITGYWVTQVVRTAAELHIADHLHAGPATARDIARAESLDPAAAFRFLRACVAVDLAACHDGEHFTGTPLLETLRTDRPGSLRDLALWGGMTSHWRPWDRLVEAVRSGEAQAPAVMGKDLFAYFAEHPEEGNRFTAAMSAMTEGVAEHLADVIDFRGHERVVDVGGAAGAFVQSLMVRHPSLRGAVLDLPRLADAAGSSAAAAGVADRFEFVGGDFFASVPAADVYLLKYVLHDWDDESAVRILRTCRESLHEGGRVLVAELVVETEDATGLPPLMDLNMLTLSSGGRERSRPEFEALFHEAGLRLKRLTPSASLVSVLETVPA
ncbi:acetylserotonin O-methyltransferase [Streptomyces fuscigenes]|uniref:acetylserotonin O-methyltransferase n=1 Tax=Streptomyces fuscigenes TaxID=1528880 RepID=UPI001F373ADF|nr:acetylserotonin O-methyltransferase [Streptomyces fuscigenes]MCF3960863.1 acetylserotonin O-methyltransferase [Streptomyces fuscigenes]